MDLYPIDSLVAAMLAQGRGRHGGRLFLGCGFWDAISRMRSPRSLQIFVCRYSTVLVLTIGEWRIITLAKKFPSEFSDICKTSRFPHLALRLKFPPVEFVQSAQNLDNSSNSRFCSGLSIPSRVIQQPKSAHTVCLTGFGSTS